jgi:hypothetical protein
MLKILAVFAWQLASVSLLAADLTVHTNFEGGSARIEKLDQATRTISISPGGDPARGWPCWWFIRVEGAAVGETLTIDLGASPAHARNNGKDTMKPLSADGKNARPPHRIKNPRPNDSTLGCMGASVYSAAYR